MEIIKFLELLNFKPKNDEINIYEKTYKEVRIEVNVEKLIVQYPEYNKETQTGFHWDRTTSFSLKLEENFSVLECIDRLLSIGYRSKDITLEKKYPVGRTDVWLDVLVKKEGKAFLMIECKSKEEYEKTIRDSFLLKPNKEPKSQLLSYFNQDKDAEYICYYNSYVYNNQIYTQYDYIDTSEDYISNSANENFKNASSTLNIFNLWNKTYKNNGLFNEAYAVKDSKIQKANLRSIDNTDISKHIFNQFLNILRMNAISDKSNAFNKIFNLFIAKIKDEDSKEQEEIMDFQYHEGESINDFTVRLLKLYNEGVEQYLSLKNEDVSLLANLKKSLPLNQYMHLEKMYLLKDTTFQFLEVYDEDTFLINCNIVKEIVKLLQNFKLKYSHKQQFLGDFFENLLNSGVKQENGQFFTPIPITRFIIKSLPISQIIENKILLNKKLSNSNNLDILPYVIDYAAGSGHFLTEVMDIIHSILLELINSSKWNNSKIKNTLLNYTNENDLYNWAPEYIYGIEKDYRLAKTAKINCFLNGDGNANMLNGDGLDSFQNSKKYIKRLLSNNSKNEKFDVVISNPPYSVEGFINTLKNKDDFSLASYISEDSDDIECLFIERTAQLLAVGGYAAIVLPTSILFNEGVFTKTRKYIIDNFKIVSIVDLTSKGKIFAKTDTNALILFLQKTEKINLEEEIKKNIELNKDLTINHIENPISKFAEKIYGMNLVDYFNLFILKDDNKIYKNYAEAYPKANNIKEIILTNEIEKISCFLKTINTKTLIVTFPEESNDLKYYLGYYFSERRNNEGINYILNEQTNKLSSNLYNDDCNDGKVSDIILKHINGEDIESYCEGSSYFKVKTLSDAIRFKDCEAKIVINTKFNDSYDIEDFKLLPELLDNKNFSFVTIKEYIEKYKGETLNGYAFKSKMMTNNKNDIPVIKITNIKDSKIMVEENNKQQYIVKKPDYSKFEIKENDLVIALTGATSGKYAISEKNCGYLNQRVGLLRTQDVKHIYYLLNILNISNAEEKFRNIFSLGNAQGNISLDDDICKTLIPIPSNLEQLNLEQILSISNLNELIALIK